MRLRCQGMVGIKTEDRFLFAALRWIGSDGLEVRCDDALPPGTPCELKVELRERPNALLLEGRLVEEAPGPAGGPHRYRFATRPAGPEQAARLAAWLEDLQAGGSSVHPDLWSHETSEGSGSLLSDTFGAPTRRRKRVRDVLRARFEEPPEPASDEVEVRVEPDGTIR